MIIFARLFSLKTDQPRAHRLKEHARHFLWPTQAPHYTSFFHNFILHNHLIESFRANSSLPSSTELICYESLTRPIENKPYPKAKRFEFVVNHYFLVSDAVHPYPPEWLISHFQLAFCMRDSTWLISGWVFSETPILSAVEIENKNKILISANTRWHSAGTTWITGKAEARLGACLCGRSVFPAGLRKCCFVCLSHQTFVFVVCFDSCEYSLRFHPCKCISPTTKACKWLPQH